MQPTVGYVYVDNRYSGPSPDGTLTRPFLTLNDAVTTNVEAGSDSTIVVAGSPTSYTCSVLGDSQVSSKYLTSFRVVGVPARDGQTTTVESLSLDTVSSPALRSFQLENLQVLDSQLDFSTRPGMSLALKDVLAVDSPIKLSGVVGAGPSSFSATRCKFLRDTVLGEGDKVLDLEGVSLAVVVGSYANGGLRASDIGSFEFLFNTATGLLPGDEIDFGTVLRDEALGTLLEFWYHTVTPAEITYGGVTLPNSMALGGLVVNIVNHTILVENLDYRVDGADLMWSGMPGESLVEAGTILRVLANAKSGTGYPMFSRIGFSNINFNACPISIQSNPRVRVFCNNTHLSPGFPLGMDVDGTTADPLYAAATPSGTNGYQAGSPNIGYVTAPRLEARLRAVYPYLSLRYRFPLDITWDIGHQEAFIPTRDLDALVSLTGDDEYGTWGPGAPARSISAVSGGSSTVTVDAATHGGTAPLVEGQMSFNAAGAGMSVDGGYARISRGLQLPISSGNLAFVDSRVAVEGTGTEASPYKTLAAAVAGTSAADTIVMVGGSEFAGMPVQGRTVTVLGGRYSDPLVTLPAQELQDPAGILWSFSTEGTTSVKVFPGGFTVKVTP